jgi:archaellum component FlaF (FlaF/FlaG flagellin family)
MWTVAVNAGDTDKSVLSQCANDDTHAKSTEDPTELAKIFTEIAGNIKAAVQDASVTDPMGTGFTIPAGSVDSITTSQGTATYDANNKTISWEFGTLSNTIDDDPTVKYAELTYRVTIDDSILTATPEEDGKSYKTNGTTTINYKDATGADQTGEFVSPTVDPVLLVVQKKLYDKQGKEVTNSDQTFSVNVKGDAKSGQAYDQTYTLKPGERKVLTNLRWEDTYTVTETGYPDGKSKDDYTTEVKVGKDVTNSFTVKQGVDDKDIVVTNREHPTLTLLKTVTGDLADKTKEFTFNVTVKRGDQTVIDNKTYTLKDGDSTTIAPDSGALLPGDQVTITETNGDGYATTYVVDNGTSQDGSGTKASFNLSGDTTVSFTNSKSLVPITGLDGNEGIPILPAVLGVGAITAVLCVAITRRLGVRGE